jgi:hypothetical protein
MQHAPWTVCLAAVLVGFDSTATAQSEGGWDVVLNGRAVHMNATKDWNEDNWGIGMEREFASTGRWIKVAMVNGFEDSMGDPSFMAGGGLKRRFRPGGGAFYADLGGVAFLMTRQTVNRGQPFPGLLPAATFGFKRVAVNVTYMPERVADYVTHSRSYDSSMHGVFFLQLKLDASLFGVGRRERPYLAESTAH